MKKIIKKQDVQLLLISISFICIIFLIFCNLSNNSFFSNLTPWVAVGGCGSSAGGASGDAQLKWIGTGVPGALFDCELLISNGALSKTSTKLSGEDKIVDSDYDGQLRMQTISALLSLYYHPPRIADIKLTMPFLFKEGINIKDKTITNTGPFGDLSLDISRKFGASGNINAALVVLFPTGNANIMRGGIEPMPADNQLGGGLFSLSPRGTYTFDFDWGIITLGATYSLGLFAITTTEYEFTPARMENGIFYEEKLSSVKKTFKFVREGLGARNDAGLYTPDYLGLFSDFGIKTENFTHGISINYSHPLAKGFYEQREVTQTSVLANLPTREAALLYLDTCRTGDILHGDTLNVLLNQTPEGTWNYLRKSPAPRKTLPGFSIQYSLEKSDMLLPLLLGGVVKLEIDKKLVFSAISFGMGFKFPIY